MFCSVLQDKGHNVDIMDIDDVDFNTTDDGIFGWFGTIIFLKRVLTFLFGCAYTETHKTIQSSGISPF